MAKAKKGTGRIEFLALQEEVKKLLHQGHTVKSAHEELQAKKKGLNLSYEMLLRYLKNGVSLKFTGENPGSEEKSLSQEQAEGQPPAKKDKPKQQQKVENTEYEEFWEGDE